MDGRSRLMSTKELAEYTGLSPQFFYHDRCSGRNLFPYIKIGGAVRYRLEDVEKRLREATVEAAA